MFLYQNSFPLQARVHVYLFLEMGIRLPSRRLVNYKPLESESKRVRKRVRTSFSGGDTNKVLVGNCY